jgi:hypothetical protein
MRKIWVVIALLALVACGKKKDDAGGEQGSGSAVAKLAEQPMTCPPGNVIKDGACVAVITPEKVAVVAQQQSRIDELATLLDRVDTVAAPIELMNGIRQLDQWKTYVAQNERLKVLDGMVAALDEAVKQLRVFKASLGEASARLGNLKGELDRMMKDTGAAKKIEEVRTQISSQVRVALEPLAVQVANTIQGALTPLVTQLEDAANVVTLGCAAMALGRAGDRSKELCDKATGLFSEGKKYLAEVKSRPAAMFDDVAKQIETALDALLDEQSRKIIDAAQATVNQALNLPPPRLGGDGSGAGGSAAGGAAAAGSGSAAR